MYLRVLLLLMLNVLILQAQPLQNENIVIQQSSKTTTVPHFRTSSFNSRTSKDIDNTMEVKTLKQLFNECRQKLSSECIRPRLLIYFDSLLMQNSIRLTDTLTVVRANNEYDGDSRSFSNSDIELTPIPMDEEAQDDILDRLLMDRMSRFFHSRKLFVALPRDDGSFMGGMSNVAKSLLGSNYFTFDMEVPSALRDSSEGRLKNIIMMKKMMRMMMPMLMMFKVKLFAFFLIALAVKSWKAITISLLSLVLSSIIGIKSLVGSKNNKSSVEHVHKWQPSHSRADYFAPKAEYSNRHPYRYYYDNHHHEDSQHSHD